MTAIDMRMTIDLLKGISHILGQELENDAPAEIVEQLNIAHKMIRRTHLMCQIALHKQSLERRELEAEKLRYMISDLTKELVRIDD